MALTQAKCTNCGAPLEVDSLKEAAICPYCKTAYIVEKAINNYNISDSVVNIYNSGKDIDFEREGHKLIAYTGKDEDVIIPDYISVIGTDAFRNNRILKKISIPDSVEMIEFRAFAGCESLKEVIMPDSVKNVSSNIFSGCTSLERVKLSKNLRILGASMFNRCKSLEEIDISENIIIIKDSAFYGCIRLRNVSIPKNVQNIEWFAFGNCNLDSIIFQNEENLQKMGGGIFYECPKLPEITPAHFAKQYAKNFSITEATSNDLEKMKNRKGCYIATSIYGSYDCPQVWTLRRFRDNTLAKSILGRGFIKTYYFISPKMVKKLKDNQYFQRIGKSFLDKLVTKLNKKGVEDTQYYDQ